MPQQFEDQWVSVSRGVQVSDRAPQALDDLQMHTPWMANYKLTYPIKWWEQVSLPEFYHTLDLLPLNALALEELKYMVGSIVDPWVLDVEDLSLTAHPYGIRIAMP